MKISIFLERTRLLRGWPTRSFISFLVLASVPGAQWTGDPATNTVVADGAGQQAGTRLAATSDGGFYLSWLDENGVASPPISYDLHLQRLDAQGIAQWAHSGVRVAGDTGEYDLSVDSSGNALLAYLEDHLGGLQLTVAKIDPTGAASWGATGVQLTGTTDSIENPKIAGATDGHTIVAWTQGTTVRLQRLDAGGVATWATDVVLTPAFSTHSYAAADLDASSSGTVILSFVGAGGSLAQKFDAAGVALWGAEHVQVSSFTLGGPPSDFCPQMVPDGSGGAAFAWHVDENQPRAFAQRLDAGGAELFAHGGVPVSTMGNLQRQPAVAFDSASQSTYVFWPEYDFFTQLSGVSGQRFDATGTRLWGPSGMVIVPLGGNFTSSVTALALGSRVVTTWNYWTSLGSSVIQGAILDQDGTFVVLPLATTSSLKRDVAAVRTSYEIGVIGWSDGRMNFDMDIYMQNFLSNGTLGGLAHHVVRNGLGINMPFYSAMNEPRIGHTWMTQVSHAHHPGALLTIQQYRMSQANGPVLPYGQALVSGALLLSQILPAGGTVSTHTLELPLAADLVNTSVYTQAAILGGGPELANAIDITIGL